MRYTSLLAAALICSSLAAQNQLSNYPAATTFTSRGNNGVAAGEILMGYHKVSWRGIGELNVKTVQITKLSATTQDQTGTTAEKYNWIVRRGTDAKGPTIGTAGEVYVSALLTTPPSTATGPTAFSITHTPKTPIAIPAADDFFSIGLRLAAAPKWSADGMSCHAASGATAGAGAQQKDQAWQILAKATSATSPSSMRAWNMTIDILNPAFQVANVIAGKSNYGQGGLFPDVAKSQGLALRIRAKGADGQIALVFAAADFFPGKLPVFFGTRLYLNPSTLVGTPFVLGVVAKDAAEAVVAAKLPSFMAKKSVAFQGLLLDVKASKITLSNAAQVQF